MIPIAFRIRDFRSIQDSRIFSPSGDNITVLAGQNEAGKTALLLALRDFDLKPGELPETPEFQPEGNLDAEPRVAVQFRLEEGDAEYLQKEIDFPEFFDRFGEVDTFWVERHLNTGTYTLDHVIKEMWTTAKAARTVATVNAENAASATDNTDEKAELPTASLDEGSSEEAGTTAASPNVNDLTEAMRLIWPLFVYFDSFQDTLPRQVDVDDLLAVDTDSSTVAESVKDFIALADIDPARVKELGEDDKALGNYLDGRGIEVTGDFLTYWQQKVDGEQNVQLVVRHLRDGSGKLKLAFYVRDQVNQYPDQRSKGFLWFLSFYLRLAANQKTEPDERRVLLIDEPGSYLHARAQRDILYLFENRIAQGKQIIYSSHSPFLIPSHTLHRVRVVMKTHRNGTRVYDRLTHPELRGQDFADTLTPLIQAIGIDLSQAFSFQRPNSVFVEGITDHIYVTNWARLFNPEFNDQVNVLPGFGATTLPVLASLFIGWRQTFVVLLDRDAEGMKTRERLTRDLLVPETKVVQPRDALAIEDIFSAEDFRTLLKTLDPTLALNTNESPSAAVKRQNVDKVPLAKTFAERVARGETTLTKKTQDRIGRLFDDLSNAM